MKKINLIVATLVAAVFIGCGEDTTTTEYETIYVDRNITVEVPVEKIVEVEVPVDVYIYQDYTSQINFQDLRVDINCVEGNCTASILEYNCYPPEVSGGPLCNCGYFPIEEYKSELHCITECEVIYPDPCETEDISNGCSSEEASSSSSSSEVCEE